MLYLSVREVQELNEKEKKELLDISVDPKECDVEVNCLNCGKSIGYASKDLFFEDFALICVECGLK